ncbi:hypothetical protein F383_11570 [Gossypium arboreum]|uniref:Uncharacterized protein n=1 Tax=Gossypium arboreum TaxID=29729 RepID=A0A0B0N5X2_GOSAR|nr:hypothetical protein F383_11570 [Gossypium arboreum]
MDSRSILLGSSPMYCQSKNASLQLDLLDNILVLQSVCLFSIRLRTCLTLSTNTRCLSILLFDTT